MRLIKKKGIIIFWFFLVADCFFIFLEQLTIANIFKSLLMPTLIAYLLLNARKNVHHISKIYFISAFFFAWIGDLLLINNNDTSFLIGMISFLIMHIIYAISFYNIRPISFSKSYQSLLAALFMIGICIPFYILLENYLGVFKIPVIIYMTTISVVVILSANILQSFTKRSLATNFFIPGAILFVLSDAVLTVNKFYLMEPFLNVVVILSYGYAQALIAEGFCKILKS